MYINYDLARTLLEDRRRRSMSNALIGRRAPEPKIVESPPEAEVIELTFGAHCGSERIGA